MYGSDPFPHALRARMIIVTNMKMFKRRSNQNPKESTQYLAGDPCQGTPKTNSHFRGTKTLPARVPNILIFLLFFKKTMCFKHNGFVDDVVYHVAHLLSSLPLQFSRSSVELLRNCGRRHGGGNAEGKWIM